MANQKRKIVIPAYMKKFSCIGPACEDSCCIGWKVTIDEPSYKKYKKITDLELREMLGQHVKRQRSQTSFNNYARIRMRANHACPFLDDDRLCRIQKKMGEDYLSITCATYPRSYSTVDGTLEVSATLSCPEAARLALLDPEGIQFIENTQDANTRTAFGNSLDTRDPAMSGRPVKYFWPLRTFSLQLLKSRDYMLWERLIILGLFCSQLSRNIQEKRTTWIPELIEKYENMIVDGSFKEDLKDIPTQTTIQMELIKELVDERFARDVFSHRYLACVSACLQGIGYRADASKEEIGERYQQAYIDYYEPFMRDKEYILENYLVNYVFRHVFPFSSQEDVFYNYVMLVIHYAMIRMLLIGMAAYYRQDFNEEHIIKLIQSFAKTVEHNTDYLKRIMQLLIDNNLNTMAYMAIMIKN